MVSGRILRATESFRKLNCSSSDKCDDEIHYNSPKTSFGLIPIVLVL
jgi:hypothetical protein